MRDGFPYLPERQRALAFCIRAALGRNEDLELGDVHRRVRHDFGEVSTRTVLRVLSSMVGRGDVWRGGIRGHYTYANPRVTVGQ